LETAIQKWLRRAKERSDAEKKPIGTAINSFYYSCVTIILNASWNFYVCSAIYGL